MLKYLLHFFEYDLDRFINEVLHDSKEDPEYSAVTLINLIKCYISVSCELQNDLPYKDVKSYLLYCGYTDQDYNLLETKRAIESPYYVGEQF